MLKIISTSQAACKEREHFTGLKPSPVSQAVTLLPFCFYVTKLDYRDNQLIL